MFTYLLSGKVIENGQNRITVDYTNGAVKCAETFFFTSTEDLDNRITIKIATLERVVALDEGLVTTDYIKSEPAPPPNKTPLQIAEADLYELKPLVELGVVKETDDEYIRAIAAYKVASLL